MPITRKNHKKKIWMRNRRNGQNVYGGRIDNDVTFPLIQIIKSAQPNDKIKLQDLLKRITENNNKFYFSSSSRAASEKAIYDELNKVIQGMNINNESFKTLVASKLSPVKSNSTLRERLTNFGTNFGRWINRQMSGPSANDIQAKIDALKKSLNDEKNKLLAYITVPNIMPNITLETELTMYKPPMIPKLNYGDVILSIMERIKNTNESTSITEITNSYNILVAFLEQWKDEWQNADINLMSADIAKFDNFEKLHKNFYELIVNYVNNKIAEVLQYKYNRIESIKYEILENLKKLNTAQPVTDNSSVPVVPVASQVVPAAGGSRKRQRKYRRVTKKI